MWLYDLGAFVAASVMNSMTKFDGGPMTGPRLLGRDALAWDERVTRPSRDIESPDAVRGLSLVKKAEQTRAARMKKGG